MTANAGTPLGGTSPTPRCLASLLELKHGLRVSCRRAQQSCQALMLREQFHGAAASAGQTPATNLGLGQAMNSAGSAVLCHRHDRGWHSNCT